jgi:hypothetical protein
MVIKLYYTKEEIEAYLAKKGYVIKLVPAKNYNPQYENTAIKTKRVFKFGKPVKGNPRPEDLFQDLLRKALLNI